MRSLGFAFFLLLSQAKSTAAPGEPTKLEREYRELVNSYNKRTGAKLVSVATLKKWMAQGKKLVILDVRQADEHAVATLPGAILVAPSKKNGWPKLDLPKDATVVGFCTIGFRAGCAARAYKDILKRDFYTLDGGLIQWFNEGGVVVDASGKPVDKIDAYMPDLEKFVKVRPEGH